MHSPFPVFIYLGTILIVPVNPDSRRALKPKGLFPIPNQRSIVSLNLFLIHCFGNLPSFPLIFPLIAHESRKKRLLLSLFPFSKTQNEHSPSWLLSMITGCHLLSKHFQERQSGKNRKGPGEEHPIQHGALSTHAWLPEGQLRSREKPPKTKGNGRNPTRSVRCSF